MSRSDRVVLVVGIWAALSGAAGHACGRGGSDVGMDSEVGADTKVAADRLSPGENGECADRADEAGRSGVTSRLPEFSFGMNVYHTSPAFWPPSGVSEVVDRIADGDGREEVRTLRFFLPTLSPAAESWQQEWLDETYAFIDAAAHDQRIENLLVVVGYGLDYHLSPDVRQLLPGDPDGYVEAVCDIVRGQVEHVRQSTADSGVNVCWQIENELDIAHHQRARPGADGRPWTDDAFRRKLMVGLRDAVEEGWAADDAGTCILVTYTPRSFGSREAYPWADASAHPWADSIDFIGVHYYWIDLLPLDWWVSDMGASIKEMAAKHSRPVMITEAGVQARTDEAGAVTSDEKTIMEWMSLTVGEVQALRQAGVPLLGLTYFKWCDADAATEDACGYQGHLGFFKLGGSWLGHEEKRFDDHPEEGGPWAYYCKTIAGWSRKE